MQLRQPYVQNSRLGNRPNPDPVFWRLIYADGRMIEEKPAGSTIMEAWPNPCKLQVVDWAGHPVCEIPIPLGSSPIWYRRRSAAIEDPHTTLLATVFGYGRDIGSRVEGRLFAWVNGKIGNCPPEHEDPGAVAFQLSAVKV